MSESKINTIDVHELKKRRDNNPELCIIDVREKHEWQEIHIPGALHIPKDELSEYITAKISDHSCPIYMHCRGGVRSLHAAQTLLSMGYKEVYSINGGIIAWETAGYPVEK